MKNPKTSNESGPGSTAQPIEALRERHQRLAEERVRAEQNLRNLREQLDALKTEARERYGTDDLEKLRTQLAEMRAENERRRAAYQQHLDEVETRLAEIEQAHRASSETTKGT